MDFVAFGTFTASLCLDPRYLKEFHQGNFIYLAQQKGAGKTMYDLQIMEHYEVQNPRYFHSNFDKKIRSIINY